MASKIANIAGIGPVNLYKRRGSRAIRLSFGHDGSVRVTVPYWLPYQAGIEFARSKADWIAKNRPAAGTMLKDGDRIGKAHQLIFEGRDVNRTTATVRNNQIRVAYAQTTSPASPAVQKAATAAAQRALKKEAEALLPQRLGQLARANEFDFRNVTVKQLKSRWGSCNSRHEIVLSFYLMQLPWQLIDYVLLHELTHTEQLNHSSAFWGRLEKAMPGAKPMRKLLKSYRPVVTAQN